MDEDRGFGGEVAGFYHRYRRGYPPAVIDTLIGAFSLTTDDVVIDLGCGTGQLTLPIASRVRAVAGVVPEPGMLAHAHRAAAEQGITNASWLLGADTDIPALAGLLGSRRAGAVTIAQALHWMGYRELIPALVPLLRPGGGIAVITNGTPMWLHDSPWSRVLRGFLEQWLDTTLTSTCGTDDASQQRYRDTMTEAGLDATETRYDYTDELDFDHLLGGLYSALPSQRLPPAGPTGSLRRPGPPRRRPAGTVHRARPCQDAARADSTAGNHKNRPGLTGAARRHAVPRSSDSMAKDSLVAHPRGPVPGPPDVLPARACIPASCQSVTVSQ